MSAKFKALKRTAMR